MVADLVLVGERSALPRAGRPVPASFVGKPALTQDTSAGVRLGVLRPAGRGRYRGVPPQDLVSRVSPFEYGGGIPV